MKNVVKRIFFAKFRFDTAENEHAKNFAKFAKNLLLHLLHRLSSRHGYVSCDYVSLACSGADAERRCRPVTQPAVCGLTLSTPSAQSRRVARGFFLSRFLTCAVPHWSVPCVHGPWLTSQSQKIVFLLRGDASIKSGFCKSRTRCLKWTETEKDNRDQISSPHALSSEECMPDL